MKYNDVVRCTFQHWTFQFGKTDLTAAVCHMHEALRIHPEHMKNAALYKQANTEPTTSCLVPERGHSPESNVRVICNFYHIERRPL